MGSSIDRYVRIGNGNQLVRDPKKRTRILASEKVRWSLHTARSRLARKRKYCQFFTRFGKCNKDDGKCPYIHDASKIAVCTKFLNGLCFNSDCKLTHKVYEKTWQNYLAVLCSKDGWISGLDIICWICLFCRWFQKGCQIALTICKVLYLPLVNVLVWMQSGDNFFCRSLHQ